MYKLIVNTSKGMAVEEAYVAEPSCIVGQKPDLKVVLPGWGVSDEHARFENCDGEIYIEDLKSRTGTLVNGKRITRYGPLVEADVIQIHDYLIRVNGQKKQKTLEQTVPSEIVEEPEAKQVSSEKSEVPKKVTALEPPEAVGISKEMTPQARVMHEWRVKLRKLLHEQMDLRRIDVSAMTDEQLRSFTSELIAELLQRFHNFPQEIDREQLKQQVVAEAVGLGPLEPLLALDDISEIMVNSAHEVFYERKGRLSKSDVTFTDDQAVLAIIQRIVAPVGRRIDESSPMVDARLKDGSRVNAVIPPLALKGPSLTIRKFMKERLTSQHLLGFDSVSEQMVNFLEIAVRNKSSLIISGGTGSGKTTLLNVLSNNIPDRERIITIEDSAELRLYQPNLVALEARPPNQEGSGAIMIRDLVRNSLRMRPDRIVVGECRGGEALDMLQAMNTGHEGSLTTVHSNSARDCLSRIEVMVMMAGMDLPITAIREQIASAVHLIVQQTRFPCGSRKITSISEVVGMEQDRIQLAEIFRFKQEGYDQEGRIQGRFVPTGLIPEFYQGLQQRGIDADLGIFNEDEAA